MPGVEERLRSELERLGHPGDPDGAFDRVASKRVRRRVIRRVQVVALVVAVVAGTSAGTLVLAKVFSGTTSRQPVSVVENGALAFAVTLNVQELNGPRGGEIRNSEIFSVNPDGSGQRRLTRFAAMDGDPSFSPDGRLIAFTRGIEVPTPDGGLAVHQAIFVMNADGTGVRRLTGCPRLRCPSLDGSPVWSPDGTRIAFTRGQAIDLMEPDGTGLHAVCRDCANGFGPLALTWSPDGTRIAYSVHLPDGFGLPAPLYTVDVHSGQVHLLTNRCYPHCTLGEVTLDFHPSWSPDGTRIAFDRQIGGAHQIFVVNADGSGLRHLYGSPTPSLDPRCAASGSPVWSPDGRKIAFVAGLRSSNCAVNVIQLMDTRGRFLEAVPNTVGAESIAWQPLVLGEGSPHPSPNGSGSPSIIPSVTPPGAYTPGQPPFIGYTCGGSEVAGDFDGDGLLDTAAVHPTGATFQDQPMPCPSPLPGYAQQEAFSLTVAWGSGTRGTWDLPDCVQACEAYGTGDIDGNHTDELAVVVGSHGATKTIEVLELPNTREIGPPTREIAPGAFPAQTPHGPGAPLLFDVSVGPRHVDTVTCQTAASGDQQLLATGADLSTDGTTWTLHQEVFGVVDQSFRLESSRTFSEPAQPGGPYTEGNGCFEPYD